MPRVRPEERQKMETDGTWKLFKARKQELQDTGGCTPGQAHVAALAEYYCPDLQADDSSGLIAPLDQADVDESDFMPRDMARAGCDEGMLKSVKWVASVLGAGDAQPEHAPSAQAWCLYLTYRARSMWERFWERFGSAMMPTRVNAESKDRFTDDGRDIDPAFLCRIEQARDAAVLQASTQSNRPHRDFNFELDPRGMAVLLASPVKLVFAPWEVSSHVWIRAEDLDALAKRGAAGAWLAGACRSWLERWRTGMGVDGFNPFDTLGVGWVTHPGLIETMEVGVWIEEAADDRWPTSEAGGATRTKPYLFVDAERDDIKRAIYCYRPKAGFKPMLLDRLAGEP